MVKMKNKTKEKKSRSKGGFLNKSLEDRFMVKGAVLDLSGLALSKQDFIEILSWLSDHYHSFMRVVWGDVGAECQDFKSEVEQKIHECERKFEDRPKPYVCVSFAKLAYSDEAELKESKAIPEGWAYLSARDCVVEDGYFGVTFINHDSRQIILAHRGTHSMVKDLSTDILGVVKGAVEGQQESALDYAKKVVEIAKGYDYRVGFVGHSLGGWLAQLTTCWCKALGLDDVYAVTLDTPGAEGMMINYLDGKTIVPMIDIDLNNMDFTHYLSVPNIVNSCNKQAGDLFHITPQFYSEKKGWRSWFSLGSWLEWGIYFQKDVEYLLQAHSSANLLAAFDPLTGMPKEELVYKVVSWPDLGKMGKYYAPFFQLAAQNKKMLYELGSLKKKDRYLVEEIAKFNIKEVDNREIMLVHFSPRAQIWLKRMEKKERNDRYQIEKIAGLSTGVLSENLQYELHEKGTLFVKTKGMSGWEFREKVEKLLKLYPILHLLAADLDWDLNQKEVELLLDSQEEMVINFCEDIVLTRLYLYSPASEEEIQRHKEIKVLFLEKIAFREKLLNRLGEKEIWANELREQIAQLRIMAEISEVFALYKSRFFEEAKAHAEAALRIADKFYLLGQSSRFSACIHSILAKIDRCNWLEEKDLKNSAANYMKALDEKSGLSNIASIWSNYGALLNNWGEWLQWEGRAEESLLKQKEALEVHKKAHDLILKGKWLFHGKEYGEVLSTEVKRDYARSLFLLSKMQYELEQITESAYQEKLRRVLMFFSAGELKSKTSATTLLFKGIIYQELGNSEKALECYLSGLKAEPNHVTILSRLAFCYEEQGDLNIALEYAQRSYKKFLDRGEQTVEDQYHLCLVVNRIDKINSLMSREQFTEMSKGN